MSVLPFKEDEDFKKHNQHAEESIAPQLRNFVADFEAIDAQVSDLRRDQKDMMTVMKSKGFNMKALRRLLSERKRDAADLQEEKEIAEMYRDLLI